LPRIARNMHDMAIVRSMSTREGDHGRGAYLLRTGYPQQGPIRYPSLGSLVAKELANDETPLPNYVSIYPPRGLGPDVYGSGYLGPRYAPLVVGDDSTPQRADLSPRIPNLQPADGISPAQSNSRVDLLLDMEREFASRNPGLSPQSHAMAYERAVRLMRSAAASAFNVEEEPIRLRDQYGLNPFGQGCLLARRLVERGVPFVEVTLGGNLGNGGDWDTHAQNFQRVQQLSEALDPGFGTLMEDLRARGMLESTLIVWMGEFGRTPRINGAAGRDHWPNSFSAVLAGGGIRGGQAYGQTSADGLMVESAPTDVKSFLATVWRGLGIDHTRQNISNIGRPIRLADAGARPIADIVG